MKKKLMVVCAAICFACFGSIVATAESIEVEVPQTENVGNGGASTYSEKIVWVVKIENGKKYRRLFNTTTGEYIGDWIPCD